MAASTDKMLNLLNQDHELSIPTTNNLRGISTPMEHNAWVSGDHGTIIHTINHGKNWVKSQIPDTETLDFRDIKAFESDVAYVMSAGSGELSRIYKTVDGGVSWQLQLKSSDQGAFFDGMAFWSKDHGMVPSDPVEGRFRVYVTKNGGETWTTTPESGMPMALAEEHAFAASGRCMTVQGKLNGWFGTGGNAARVFHTTDGGQTWQVNNTSIMKNTPTSGIFSLSFANAKNGVIVGGDYKNPEEGGANLAMTGDGGISWQLVNLSHQFYWSAVSYTPDKDHIIVVGSKQAGIIKSKSPKTWEVNLNSFSFWSNNRILAVGPQDTNKELDVQEHCSTPTQEELYSIVM